MSMLPPVLVELKANAGEFMAKMGEAQHEVKKLGTESASHMQKFAAVGKAALFGIGAAAVTVGGFSLEMADKFEVSHARLEAALKGAGTSMDAWKSNVASTDSRMEHLGYTNAQTENALSRLVVALQDPAKAMQVLSTASDLARAKGLDLADASTMVAKAMEGNSRALKQMGIDLPINAKSAEQLKVAQEQLRLATQQYQAQVERMHSKHKVTAADLATLKVAHDRLKFAQQQVNEAQRAGTLILDALNQRLGGQSQQYTETFAGKVQVLKAQVEDLGAKIGLALIPILEKLASATASVVNWFEKHRTAAKVLGLAVGTVLVAAMTAYAVSAATAAAATVAATWPILAIIAAVAALGVGIYELAKHWSTVWDGIKAVASAVWGFLRPIFDAVLNVGLVPIRLEINVLKGAFQTAWGAIQTVVTDVWGVLKPIFDAIQTAVSDTLNAVGKLGSIAHHGGGIVGKVLSHIPGGFLASGTNYATGGWTMVGERGPELVNLPRGSKVFPNGTGPGGGSSLMVNIYGPVYGADADQLAQKIRLALVRQGKRNGNTTLLGMA